MKSNFETDVIGGQGQQRTGKIRRLRDGGGTSRTPVTRKTRVPSAGSTPPQVFSSRSGPAPAQSRHATHIALNPQGFTETAPPLDGFVLQAPRLGARIMTMENMTKNLMLGTAMALALASAARAQDLFRAEMDPVAITVSDFVGKRVYVAETAVHADEFAGVQDGWTDIGDINDVVLTRDDRVDAALVDIGGFLGMDERQVALGMEDIRFVSDSATAEERNDFFLVINANRTILAQAPEYPRTNALPAATM
jgi:hypothetical protein